MAFSILEIVPTDSPDGSPLFLALAHRTAGHSFQLAPVELLAERRDGRAGFFDG